MITFLINCGMRVSELVGLNLSDLRKKEKTLRLLGKGNKAVSYTHLDVYKRQALERADNGCHGGMLVPFQPRRGLQTGGCRLPEAGGLYDLGFFE